MSTRGTHRGTGAFEVRPKVEPRQVVQVLHPHNHGEAHPTHVLYHQHVSSQRTRPNNLWARPRDVVTPDQRAAPPTATLTVKTKRRTSTSPQSAARVSTAMEDLREDTRCQQLRTRQRTRIEWPALCPAQRHVTSAIPATTSKP